MKNSMKKISFFFLSVFLFVACGGVSQLQAGDTVLADWYQDNWHAARLVAICKDADGREGWTVDYDDNFYDSSEGTEPVCYGIDKIVLNAAPAAGTVKVGDTVLAEWVEDAYYSAKVEKIEGEEYAVKFVTDGWESKIKADKLRLLPDRKVEVKE